MDTTRTVWIVGAIIVSMGVLTAGALLTAALMFVELPEKNKDYVLMMLGGFAPLIGVVVKFWLDNAARVVTVVQGSGTQEIKT